MGRRAGVAAAALGVLLALVTACGPRSARRQEVAVLAAQRAPGDVLVLGVASCHGHPSARVSESPSP